MSLYLQESGAQNSSTIVFLHGLGVSSWMWTEQVEVLQAHYHCMMIDLPGNGKSHRIEWQSLQESARLVAEVIRAHAQHGKAHIVGLSLGGYVAVALLTHYPDVVESVVVSGMSSQPLAVSWGMKGMLRVLPYLMQWAPFVRIQAKLLQLPPDAIPAFVEDNRVLTAPTYQRIYAEILNFQLSTMLATRPQRFLAVAGSKEATEIRAGLAGFVQVLPHGVAKIAPDVHHGWNGENPALFNAMIEAWVQGSPLPATLLDIPATPATTRILPQP